MKMESEWKFLYIEDLGEDRQCWLSCEACLGRRIRYIHHYENTNEKKFYCLKCSEKIDCPQIVNSRENGIKNENKLEKNWSKRKWKLTTNGNFKIICRNFEVLLYREENRFKIRITTPDNKVLWGKKEFDDLEEAKKESWNAFFWAVQNN